MNQMFFVTKEKKNSQRATFMEKIRWTRGQSDHSYSRMLLSCCHSKVVCIALQYTG